MMFLKQAPSFNCKAKVNIATPSAVTPQKRKSEVATTTVVNLLKKQQKQFMSDDIVAKVEGAPTEDNLSRSAELTSQFMTLFSVAFGASIKDLELLKKHNSALQEGLKKTKLDVAAKEKEVDKDLGQAKD
uniref:Uncharacterized protein n=1 Tax=Cannabis sativa TaxID=3483 RepID=A0A803PRR5_CANSA